jgi:hypothetical protein
MSSGKSASDRAALLLAEAHNGAVGGRSNVTGEDWRLVLMFGLASHLGGPHVAERTRLLDNEMLAPPVWTLLGHYTRGLPRGEYPTCDDGIVNAPTSDPPTGDDGGRRRASGIYGTILTAAVLVAGGTVLSTVALGVTVVITLIIYWVAEQYAELLGEHTHQGRLPPVAQVRASLSATFPMVTASFLPLFGLIVARLLGADTLAAAAIALVVAVILLVYHSYTAARAAGLRGAALLIASAAAALLGATMVLLKALLQHQHHLY